MTGEATACFVKGRNDVIVRPAGPFLGGLREVSLEAATGWSPMACKTIALKGDDPFTVRSVETCRDDLCQGP